MDRKSIRRWVPGVFLLSVVGSPAQGLDYGAAVGLETTNTDNYYLSGDDPQSVMETGVNFDIAAQNHGAMTDLTLSYSADQYDASDERVSGYNEVRGQGSFDIHLLPRALVWNVDRSDEVIRSDVTRANEPENREQRSTTSTGPTMQLRLSPVDLLAIDTLYSWMRFSERAENNNERVDAGVSWLHLLDFDADFSLRAGNSNVDFDSVFDYERDVVSAAYNYRRDAMSLHLEAGQNEMRSATFGNQSGGFTDIQLIIGQPLNQVRFGYSKSLTDAASGIGPVIENGVLSSRDDGIRNPDIVERRRQEIRYSLSPADTRFSYALRLSKDLEEYLNTAETQETRSLLPSVACQINGSLRANLEYDVSILDLTLAGEDRRDLARTTTLALFYLISPDLQVSFATHYLKNDSSGPLSLDDYDYHELSSTLSVRYELRPLPAFGR